MFIEREKENDDRIENANIHFFLFVRVATERER